MDVKQKRKELLHMDDKAFIDRILAFPDRERLNRDEDGKRRKYPSAEMAVRARRSMEKNPDWKISDKQKYVMADSFAQFSTDELKVSGITFAKADPNTLFKNQVSKEGVKTVYEMQFHLQPEPDNQYDKNAVAVYVDNTEGSRTKIGYVPAAYTGVHPITNEMTVKGTLTDHSNGHFKTISYAMTIDTEAVDKISFANRDPKMYTYHMPFMLNGDAKPDTADYLTNSRNWTEQLNNELEYWSVNGQADNVYFSLAGKTGYINVESSAPLNAEAMQVCGSYFRYSLESGISSDLKRDGYVNVPQTVSAINTREKTYFSLQAEPVPEEPVKDTTDEVHPMTIDQLHAAKVDAKEVWFRSDMTDINNDINSGLVGHIDRDSINVDVVPGCTWNNQQMRTGFIRVIPIDSIYATKEDLLVANREIINAQNESDDFSKAVDGIPDNNQNQSL